MKKMLKLSAVLATLAFASNAFALATITSSTTIGGGTYSPSKQVTIKVTSNGTAYSASSQHAQGTKQYATLGGTGVTGDPTKIVSSAAVSSGPSQPGSATTLPSGTWQ